MHSIYHVIRMKSYITLMLTFSVVSTASVYTVPEVTFEALKGGGFRAYIPDSNNVTLLFALHGNLNREIGSQQPGQIDGETKVSANGYLILNFANKLKVGDVLHYWIFINANRAGYRKDHMKWTVEELRKSYENLQSCVTSSTVISGVGTSTFCIGDVIFEDQFDKESIDGNKWSKEHRIPTYVGPNYEFNSYENRLDTCFNRNGNLFLKPIALNMEDEVRGELNLTAGCTSNNAEECYYRHGSSFLLPPVKSAKVKSKFSFKYGKIEIRAKLPSGDWIYPILQLEPEVQDRNDDPTAVLIAFSRGNSALRSIDMRNSNSRLDIGAQLLTTGPIVESAEPFRSSYLLTAYNQNPFSDDFHTYKLEWIPGRMIFAVDEREVGIVSLRRNLLNNTLGSNSEAPFDKQFRLTLGVAVGGLTNFPDGFNPDYGEKPWNNEERNYIKKFFDNRAQWLESWVGDNTALKVDYVKILAV